MWEDGTGGRWPPPGSGTHLGEGGASAFGQTDPFLGPSASTDQPSVPSEGAFVLFLGEGCLPPRAAGDSLMSVEPQGTPLPSHQSWCWPGLPARGRGQAQEPSRPAGPSRCPLHDWVSPVHLQPRGLIPEGRQPGPRQSQWVRFFQGSALEFRRPGGQPPRVLFVLRLWVTGMAAPGFWAGRHSSVPLSAFGVGEPLGQSPGAGKASGFSGRREMQRGAGVVPPGLLGLRVQLLARLWPSPPDHRGTPGRQALATEGLG